MKKEDQREVYILLLKCIRVFMFIPYLQYNNDCSHHMKKGNQREVYMIILRVCKSIHVYSLST